VAHRVLARTRAQTDRVTSNAMFWTWVGILAVGLAAAIGIALAGR